LGVSRLHEIRKFRREVPVLTALSYLTMEMAAEFNASAAAWPDKWKGAGLVSRNPNQYAGKTREELKAMKDAAMKEHLKQRQEKARHGN
jgi:hypothetical protein